MICSKCSIAPLHHVCVVCGVGGGCVGISHVWAGSCSAWAHNENVTTSASINTSQYNNKLDSKKPARDTDYSSSILLFLHDARQISQVYYSSSYKGGWYQSPDIWTGWEAGKDVKSCNFLSISLADQRAVGFQFNQFEIRLQNTHIKSKYQTVKSLFCLEGYLPLQFLAWFS